MEKGTDRSHHDLEAALKEADGLALAGESYAAKLIRDLVARIRDLEANLEAICPGEVAALDATAREKGDLGA